MPNDETFHNPILHPPKKNINSKIKNIFGTQIDEFLNYNRSKCQKNSEIEILSTR
jgi:hypothetical protein